MSRISDSTDAFRRVLRSPTRGVTGLVDDLLALCRDHGLQIDWQADRCRLRSSGGDWEELTDAPLRKSAFRAILARVAVLCNERLPNSVSPYGGQGELSVSAAPAATFRVKFANTAAEQRLELLVDTPSLVPAEATSDGISAQRIQHLHADGGQGRQQSADAAHQQ
jgi:hypothetical protein